eukprot:scaffold149696_cov18-Tisochrysis_lutea.AAC.1
MHWIGAVQRASQGRLLGGCWTGLLRSLGYQIPHSSSSTSSTSSNVGGGMGAGGAQIFGAHAAGVEAGGV